MLKLRVLWAAGIGFLTLLLLSGCLPDDSPRARIEQAVPVVAICRDVLASEIEFRIGRDGSNPYGGEVLWEVAGSHLFNAGDTITMGVAPEGMVAAADPGSYDPTTDDLVVRVVPVDSAAEVQASWWGAGSVSSSSWSNGKKSDPCS